MITYVSTCPSLQTNLLELEPGSCRLAGVNRCGHRFSINTYNTQYTRVHIQYIVVQNT